MKDLAAVVKELKALREKWRGDMAQVNWDNYSDVLTFHADLLLKAAEDCERFEKALKSIAVREEGMGLARTFVKIARAALSTDEGRTGE